MTSDKGQVMNMVKAILGKKLGMTQVFAENGDVVPVTVLKAGPCVVVQRKTSQTDGYEAAQLGLVEVPPPRRVKKPLEGHFKKASANPVRFLREVRLAQDGGDLKVGDKVLVDRFRRQRPGGCCRHLERARVCGIP